MGKGKSFKKGHWSNCVSEKQPQTHTENTLWLPRGRRAGEGRIRSLGLGLQTVIQDGKQGPLCVHLSRSAVQQKLAQHCRSAVLQ